MWSYDTATALFQLSWTFQLFCYLLTDTQCQVTNKHETYHQPSAGSSEPLSSVQQTTMHFVVSSNSKRNIEKQTSKFHLAMGLKDSSILRTFTTHQPLTALSTLSLYDGALVRTLSEFSLHFLVIWKFCLFHSLRRTYFYLP